MRRAVAALLCLAAAVTGCTTSATSVPVDGTGEVESGSPPAPGAVPPTGEITESRNGDSGNRGQTLQRVVSADGVSQYLDCAGSGSPTLVVIPGLDSGVSDWLGELPALRRLTRTCVYDRPGIGDSPPREGSADVDAGLHASELSAALAEARESGPFALLGHSYGGLVARAFTNKDRAQVAGLLLAEGVSPNEPTNGVAWPEAGTQVNLSRSYAATGDGPGLGDLPLVVLSASDPGGDHLNGPRYSQPTAVTEEWVRDQRDAAALSVNSILVTAKSGHVLQQDNPPATTAAVEALLTAIRSRTPLTCNADWAAVNATCSEG